LFKILEKAILYITVFLTSFLIAAGVILAFINVVARFVFHEGIDWAFELTSYLFIWSAMFGAAYLFRTGGHIKVTLLVDLLPPALSKFIIILADIVTLVYLVLIAYYGYLFIFDPDYGVYASGEVSVDLNIPMWYVYTVIPISMIIAAIFTLFKIIEDIKTPAEKIASKSESEMIIEEVKENLGEVK
jgi:C4-dicarboxylate transporter DctQ subunit